MSYRSNTKSVIIVDILILKFTSDANNANNANNASNANNGTESEAPYFAEERSSLRNQQRYRLRNKSNRRNQIQRRL